MVKANSKCNRYIVLLQALVVIAKGPLSGVAMASSSKFSEAVQKVVALETRKTDEAPRTAMGKENPRFWLAKDLQLVAALGNQTLRGVIYGNIWQLIRMTKTE